MDKKILSKSDHLNNDNYGSWSFTMEAYLKMEKVWDVIVKEKEELIGLEPQDRNQVEAYKVELDKYLDRQEKAYNLIVLNCTVSQHVHIKNTRLGSEAWNLLKDHHQPNTLNCQLRIMKRLFRKELQQGASMKDHLDEMMEMFTSLDNYGTDFKENIRVAILLTSLNEDYDNLVSGIEAWSASSRTLSNISKKLIEEWERKMDVEQKKSHTKHGGMDKYGSGTSAMARYTGTVPKGDHAFAKRGGFTCHYCGEPGHFRFECPKKKIDLRTVIEQKKADANKKNSNSGEMYSSAVLFKLNQVETLSRNWLVDSGASCHMSANNELFNDMNESPIQEVFIGNGDPIVVKGVGDVSLRISNLDTRKTYTVRDTLYVPSLVDNLLSVSKMDQKGMTVKFEDSSCYVRTKGEKYFKIASLENGVYRVIADMEQVKTVIVEEDDQLCVHQWHLKLAHRNLYDIKKMHERKLISMKNCEHSDICEDCIKGKMSRKPFPKTATPTEEALDCIVSDVCGPLSTQSIGANKYFVTFIDLYSKYGEVRFIKKKSEVTRVTINFINKLKTQMGRKPKILRTDRGLEYLNTELQNFLEKEGIQTQCTVGYAPEQNGVAERKNRTLMEAARSMLSSASLPKQFWAEAVDTANYVLNRIPDKATGITPYEKFLKKKPRLDQFHEFGEDVYVMIPHEKRRKLDNKAVKMKFIGYDNAAKGFRLTDENYKIHINREVTFCGTNNEFKRKGTGRNVELNDRSQLSVNTHPEEDDDEDSWWFGVVNSGGSSVHENQEQNPNSNQEQNLNSNQEQHEDPFFGFENENEDVSMEEPFFGFEDEQEIDQQPEIVQFHELRRSTRSNFGVKPRHLNDYQLNMVQERNDLFEPKNYEEAMTCKNSQKWLEAMLEELRSIEDNDTWKKLQLPPGRKAIGCKWVYKLKTDGQGNVVRHKARLVAKGFSQKFGIDYDEVFAPVARSQTFRLLLSVAGMRGYKVKQFDIKTAFLNGTLEEEIYMQQPPGFQKGSEVFKLKKSIYGLKQAARCWNQKLHQVLEENGFKRNEVDGCLYTRKEGSYICYILVHVDDLLVVTNDELMTSGVMKSIGQNFEMTDLGNARHYLGIDITEDADGNFQISQEGYIDKIVEEAGQEQAKISKCPMDSGYYKQKGTPLPSNCEYRKLIGMLLYLSTNSRPDIATSISILSQSVEGPYDNDLNEVRRVIRYLKGTKELKLKLSDKNKDQGVFGYSDANWAEDMRDRKSNSGYCIFVNGGLVSWCCKKQNIVALSSAESEYIALTDTSKELTWMKNIVKALDISYNEPTVIYTDSQSCISLIKNQRFSNRTKHFDTRYHYIKDEVEQGRILLKYCPTANNTADIMTKPLDNVKISLHRNGLGMN